MGRIIKTIEIEDRPAVALFDTGAVNTYVRDPLVASALRRPLDPPAQVGLGGREHTIREQCLFLGKIEGLDFSSDALLVDSLGHADGHNLDAIIGARTMEQWELVPNPRTGELDLQGLRRREFTEFWTLK